MINGLPSGYDVRPMMDSDVQDVLGIIRQHSEEDSESALDAYKRSLEGQVVLTDGPRIVGVTGGLQVDGAERTYWLSWTYLDKAAQGRRLGRVLLDGLVQMLQMTDSRKLFANVSEDDPDHLDGDTDSAMAALKKAGFTEELRHDDYYDDDEDLILLSKRIAATYTPKPHEPVLAQPMLYEVDEIVETDDAYFIDWGFDDERTATPEDLEAMVQQVQGWSGRVIFAAVMANAHEVAHFFKSNGFREDGRVKDFYDDGIDEIRLRMDMA